MVRLNGRRVLTNSREYSYNFTFHCSPFSGEWLADLGYVWYLACHRCQHYNDIIMGAIASQISCLAIVYSTVYSSADQNKHQRSASLDFMGGIKQETGEFPAQMASNAENVSIWWRHHDKRAGKPACDVWQVLAAYKSIAGNYFSINDTRYSIY